MAVRLDDIDYFLAVAKSGQVRRAALDLGVSQPAVTKGIQRLERELGFPLFDRTAKGMALTWVATQLHARAQAMRRHLGDAIKEASDLHLGAQGVLRVGVSPLYTQRVFVPACLQLHRQRPAARMVVDINLNDGLLTALRKGDLDVAINAVPAEPTDDLQAFPLFNDDLCVAVREGHPLLARRRLKLEDLADAEWMLPGTGVGGRRRLEALMAGQGLPPPRVVVEVNNTTVQLIELLMQSDLLTIVSQSMLDDYPPGTLTALPLPELRFPRQVSAYVRRGVTPSPLAERFLDVLREGSEQSAA